MGYFIEFEAFQPCAQIKWDSRTRRHFYCDTAADAPVTGLNVGDRRTDLDTAKEWHASNSTTWTQFLDGSGGGITGTIGEADSASDNTSSGTWVATAAAFSIPGGFTGGVVIINAYTTVVQDPGVQQAAADIRLNIDNTTYSVPQAFNDGSAGLNAPKGGLAIHKTLTLAAGGHTITVEFQKDSGSTGNAYLVNTHLTVLY